MLKLLLLHNYFQNKKKMKQVGTQYVSAEIHETSNSLQIDLQTHSMGLGFRFKVA